MSEKIKKALGVDFGGTFTKLAIVNENGRVEASARFATPATGRRADWFDALDAGLRELDAADELAAGRYAGIGVGVPGLVDFERGFIHDLTNVPGWTAVPLAQELEARYRVRGVVDNDVNAMALGESTFGAGRVYSHAVFVTLGTGVGGGLLINNRIYRGAHSMAGEIGHVCIDMNGPPSPQGRGGLEQYVGNRRLVERAAAALAAGRASLLREMCADDPDRLTPKLIATAAQQGDEPAREIFDFAADCLAAAFASLTYVLQPQAFIVGGGVAQAGPVLFDPLARRLRERLSPFFADRVEIKPAQLGNTAGVIGAATLAMMV